MIVKEFVCQGGWGGTEWRYTARRKTGCNIVVGIFGSQEMRAGGLPVGMLLQLAQYDLTDGSGDFRFQANRGV